MWWLVVVIVVWFWMGVVVDIGGEARGDFTCA